MPGTFLVEPRNDKSGKEAIMHNSVLITELNKHYHSGFFFFFFSDSTADSSTSLSREASERKQASIVRGKATDFLVQKRRRSVRGRVPPEGTQ